MRILIVKLSSIGDVVHALPALAAIKRALPRAQVSWVVERRAAEILKDNPLLERLIEVDTKALRRVPVYGETLLAPRQQLRRLRASSFDLAIDFQGLLKSALIARLSGARRICGFSREALREPLSRFLLTETYSPPPRSHVIARNLALARDAVGITVSGEPVALEFPIHISQQDAHQAEEIKASTSENYAVINPGGGWVTKLWSPQRFGQLADMLSARYGLRSVITYGPGESELAETVRGTMRLPEAAQTASLSLKGFFALARGARIYVGGDTGPTHLAVAAKAPVVGLFGPTEWWRNGSPYPDDICVERTDIGCRNDCHRRQCSQWICMDIEVERVVAAVGERLLRAQRGKQMKEVLQHA